MSFSQIPLYSKSWVPIHWNGEYIVTSNIFSQNPSPPPPTSPPRYPDKIQTFPNTKRTKYKRKQDTRMTKCKNTKIQTQQITKGQFTNVAKYKCNKPQMEQIRQNTKWQNAKTTKSKFWYQNVFGQVFQEKIKHIVNFVFRHVCIISICILPLLYFSYFVFCYFCISRWGTHLNYLLILSVRSSVRPELGTTVPNS